VKSTKIVPNAGGHDSVSMRQLSHETTQVIGEFETRGQPVAVTKHGNIVALLIPTSVSGIVQKYLWLNPTQAAAVRAVLGEEVVPVDLVSDVTPATPRIHQVGIKQFAQSTAESLRRAEDGELVFLLKNGQIIGLLVRFSLEELVRIKIQSDEELRLAISMVELPEALAQPLESPAVLVSQD
jgi:antitoxin (DNA-binding transcriptional repressor) of toxin-antitoxin stability system